MKMYPALLLCLCCSLCHGSEFPFSLKFKVSRSDLVFVGTVTKIQLHEISRTSGSSFKTQRVTIQVKPSEQIKGKCPPSLTFTCRSVSFIEGHIIHGRTAGFDSYGIRAGQEYICYLRTTDTGYVITSNTNQFMERIDRKKSTARDIGQTSKTVPLKAKLSQLRQIAAEPTGKPPNNNPQNQP